MSIQVQTPQTGPWARPWQWPEEVLSFARQAGVEASLDPLVEATRRLFPTALGAEVYVTVDPEIRGVSWIVFDVRVPLADVPDFLEADRQWSEKLDRCCPAPLVHAFCLRLERVKS
jgi:hypothetical protein